MIKRIFILLTLASFSANSWWFDNKTINKNQLLNRGGISYEINQSIPFTGRVIKKYDSGQLMFEDNYKNGKQHGLSKSWYDNGQKISETIYENGIIKNGTSYVWNMDGSIKSQSSYINGKPFTYKLFKDGESMCKNWGSPKKLGIYTMEECLDN
jgi:antitoxin component YwqK of YwqJK toxin-antitoxin module